MAEDTTAVASAAEPVDSGKQGKMWTQTEHDAYVKQRIDKQSAKHAEEIAAKDARIAELEAASKEANKRIADFEHAQQLADWAAQVSKESGVPAAVLRGETLEELQAHAAAIKENVSLYPPMKQQLVPNQNVHTPSMSRAEIADIRDPRQRLEAIKANLGAYERK